MTRREFVTHLALLAAGASALPAQIAAFERLYDVNTKPLGETDLLQINDIYMAFEGASRDSMLTIDFFRGSVHLLAFATHQRSSLRYAFQPDCPLLTTQHEFGWRVKDHRPFPGGDAAPDFAGTIRCTDQEGLIHNCVIRGASGRLFA